MKFTKEEARCRVLNCAKLYRQKLLNKKLIIIYRERKEFDDICGCTFRIDNPRAEDLLFLKKMVEIRINEVRNKS